ncbi:ABC transporter permease [Planctomyces sp. SH-PL14]|uniref:ABC transporter permease n=1 Tax=Planctomyces sp. SH-PL14 TaxID=1632864 RepID=UPI00078BEAC5|nr:ABC transporter permease [Planctomyces sp. SH-PL14]AMV18952.1 Macrolide export ATP-binding/permease protein MacB [Planctomyces sp. SH-PL14]
MKSLKYIWRNVTRNKLRTSLTILSIGFSLALMTVLHGYMAMQSAWGDEAKKHNRIVVLNIQGFSGKLPIANVDKVREIEGVKAAVPYAWYGGNYKEEQMPFAQFATDANYVMKVWDEFKIAPEELKAWQEDRQGCVVDRKLAEKRGWKIGDRIPVQGTFYQYDLDLTLRGMFDAPQYTDTLWFHWKYLDEGLKSNNARGSGNAGTIFAKIASAGTIPDVIKTIDSQFASSDNPTRTQTEAAFAQMFTDMMGNIQAYIQNIGLAVVFSLSLVAANAMAMSMRERTTEIAVLKAIGFPRSRVLGMILGESILIAFLGGVFGVTLGCGAIEGLHNISAQFFPFGIADMAGPWILVLLGVGAGIGLVSGIVPGVRAAQLSVVDGLRRV